MRFGGFGFNSQFGFSSPATPPSAAAGGGFDPELNYIGNGTFANSTGWTLGGAAAINGGSADIGPVNGDPVDYIQCTAAATLEAGTYIFTGDDINATESTILIRVAGEVQFIQSGGSTWSGQIVINAVSDQLIKISDAGGNAPRLDNIALRRTA